MAREHGAQSEQRVGPTGAHAVTDGCAPIIHRAEPSSTESETIMRHAPGAVQGARLARPARPGATRRRGPATRLRACARTGR
jgi:hypothetical protein